MNENEEVWTEEVWNDETVMTYEEILSNLMLSEEIVLIIPADEVEKVRTGLKNLKTRKNKKLKDAGLLQDNAVLAFQVEETGVLDLVELRIFYSSKGAVLVRKMVVPEGF